MPSRVVPLLKLERLAVERDLRARDAIRVAADRQAELRKVARVVVRRRVVAEDHVGQRTVAIGCLDGQDSGAEGHEGRFCARRVRNRVARDRAAVGERAPGLLVDACSVLRESAERRCADRDDNQVLHSVALPRAHWNIDDYLAIKLWRGADPLCGMLEAAVTAAREGDVEPSDEAKILVAGMPVRTKYGSRSPKDHVEAIHSLPYIVASAIADRNFTWVHATADKIFDPTVRRLMAVVDLDPSPPAVETRWLWAGTVTIVTTSGARIKRTVDAPRGSALRGIEWDDVEAKYRELMQQSRLPAQRLDGILATLRGLENVNDVSQLTSMLVPRR